MVLLLFLLPDLRGVFLRGLDNSRGLDTDRVFGSYQEDDNKSHSHYVRANAAGAAYGDYIATAPLPPGNSMYWRTINTNAIGGIEARPKNIALLACIKY